MSYRIPKHRHASSVLLLLFVLLVTLTGFAFSHEETPTSSHDEELNHLAGTVLCVGEDSVFTAYSGANPSRANLHTARLKRGLSDLLETSLERHDLDVEFRQSCSPSDAFVVASVRITYLDPEIYRGYEPGSYGYALSLQVGEYAGTDFFDDHYVLSGLRYIAFVEETYTETARGVFLEDHLLERTENLLEELSHAWQDANVSAGTVYMQAEGRCQGPFGLRRVVELFSCLFSRR
ncbi:MAG: hypothetical protein JSV66_13405 [Trueperaceae bacterium]|nr:MAG: hypothetical protein JSV66_13405 [Trueperaceae bacterium]